MCHKKYFSFIFLLENIIGLCNDFCTKTYKINLTELNYEILF